MGWKLDLRKTRILLTKEASETLSSSLWKTGHKVSRHPSKQIHKCILYLADFVISIHSVGYNEINSSRMLAHDFYSLIEKYWKTNTELAQRTTGIFFQIYKLKKASAHREGEHFP